MDRFITQLTVLLCLLLGNILFGNIPILAGKIIEYWSCSEEAWNRRVKWSTFLLFVGGGIFISNIFLVLLPQANQEFERHHRDNEAGNSFFSSPSKEESAHHHDSFPIPELIVLCGFFLTYVLQETMLFLCAKFKRTPREARDVRVRFCSCAKRHTECSRTFKDARPDQTLFGMEKKLMESGNGMNPVLGAATNMPLEVEADQKAELLRSSILAQAVPNYGTVTNATEVAIDNPLPVLTSPVLIEAERRLATAQQAETNYRNKFLITSMLIVITLSLQYAFLGIKLGLHTNHCYQWPYLLVACLQNCLLTFSFGSYLAVSNVELPCAALMIGLLSIVSPTGMIASMTEKNVVDQIPHLAIGVVSAVVCGTLMYTTFNEILQHKHFMSVVGLIKFLAIALGASIMIAVQYAMLTL